MISLDKGGFAAKAITIDPCANGSYLVTTRAEMYAGAPLISQSVAFSNWRDLVAFLSEDYAAANASETAGGDADCPDEATKSAMGWVRRFYPAIMARYEKGEMSFWMAFAAAIHAAANDSPDLSRP